MVASVSVDTSQSDVSVVLADAGTLNLLSSQLDLSAVFNIPSDFINTSQADLNFVSLINEDVQVSDFDILAIVLGRVEDPSVRAWTFTLDGHDFYVLRLGNQETLVYDLTTEQWYVWGSGEERLWSAYNGINWIGGNKFAQEYGSNVLVGADSNGSIYFLNPDSDMDSPAVTGRAKTEFKREVTAQLPVRGYDNFGLYEVQLIGSTGEISDALDLGIELSYSDDRGKNYISAGTVTINQNALDARANWLSLGSFSSPGRLLKIVDYGALRRIDSLTMNSDFGE